MVLEGFVVGEVIFDEAFVNAILETISNQISSSDTFSMQNFSSILQSLLQIRLNDNSLCADRVSKLAESILEKVEKNQKANAQDILCLLNVVNLNQFHYTASKKGVEND